MHTDEQNPLPADVTGAVTDDGLDIPPCLKRGKDNVPPFGKTEPLLQEAPLQTPAPSEPFDNFRIDPAEIESQIRIEADRRWRNWTPTKESLTRPRKSVFIREVRKEFYP